MRGLVNSRWSHKIVQLVRAGYHSLNLQLGVGIMGSWNVGNYFRAGRSSKRSRTAARKPNFSRRAFEWLEPRQMLTIALPTYNAVTHTLAFQGTGDNDSLTLSIVTPPVMSMFNSIKYNVNSVDITQDAVAHVTFDGGGGTDSFTINGLASPSNKFTLNGATVTASSTVATTPVDFAFSNGISTLNVNGGNSGDTFNVQSTTVITNILGGLGADIMNVCSDAGLGTGNTGNLDGIAAFLNVDLGVGANSMIVSDFGETNPANANSNVVIFNGRIMGFAGPTNTTDIAFASSSGTLNLSLLGSDTLADTFTVEDTAANISLLLVGDGGDNHFNVGSLFGLATIASPVTVFGGSGNDLLTVDDSIRSVAVNYSVTGEVDLGTTKIIQSYIGVDKLQLNGTSGINHFAVKPNANTEISINGEDPTTTPGDTLSVNLAGTTGAVRTTGPGGSGQWTFAGNNPKPVDYTNIEQSGIEDLLAYGAAASKSSQPIVKIVDAATGTATGLAGSLINAYGSTFKGGVHVALGDVNGDGIPDLIAAPGRGLEPTIKVFNLLTGTLIEQFDVYGLKFRNGVNVALGDLNADGFNDLVVTPTLGNAVVQTFINTKNAAQPFGPLGATPPKATAPVLAPTTQFLAFSPKFLGGATVVVNDVLQTGTSAQIIVGSGPGMPATVNIFPGNASGSVKTTLVPLASFNPFVKGFRGGVTVASMGTLVTVGAGIGGHSSFQEWSVLPGAPPTTTLVIEIDNVFLNSKAPLQIATNLTDFIVTQGNDAPSSSNLIGTPKFSGGAPFFTQLIAESNSAFAGGFYIALDVDS
jgi:hypothetical protein